ncbi:molybdate ABC transporter permease subunit [Kroppenstedtia pulmonis]|uniref:Molybdenum transport system permease n=1 Tax=Kroppenstedtia pulmonis TaxID=1380685 RepID=A0A7D4BQU5_9BACL|nr:molybdate ABC transporter permease subunit [Kroppenstedtia pulmonis]QKG85091.1 molybdate ABC transporter permease subunit [Kroppenstedtia pulmonis]
MNPDFWSPVRLSLEVALVASVWVFILALVAAGWMRGRRFPGKNILETLWMLPLVLPPSVVGFGLLMLLGRNSWAGQALERLFGQPVVFSWWAAVIAAVVVAFPLVYQSVKTGLASVDPVLEEAARSMGAGELRVFWHVTLPLAWRSLITGYMLGFARALGEFGATLMFAGNIPGKTQTLPTAIYIAVETGDQRLATYWMVAIIWVSFVLLSVVYRVQR